MSNSSLVAVLIFSINWSYCALFAVSGFLTTDLMPLILSIVVPWVKPSPLVSAIKLPSLFLTTVQLNPFSSKKVSPSPKESAE